MLRVFNGMVEQDPLQTLSRFRTFYQLRQWSAMSFGFPGPRLQGPEDLEQQLVLSAEENRPEERADRWLTQVFLKLPSRIGQERKQRLACQIVKIEVWWPTLELERCVVE